MSFKSKFKKEANYLHNKSNSNYDYYLDLQKFNLEKFKFEKEEKDYLFDILPYTIETERHPDFGKQEKTYHLEIFIHSYVGINKGSYLCMEKMYNKSCPICDEFRRVKEKLENDGVSNDAVWDHIKGLAYKQRILYYILYKGKKYIYDSAYKSFEKSWKSAVERKEARGVDVFPVYLNEEGCTSLEFTYIPKGQSFFDLINFDFPAIEKYNAENLKDLVSLEKLLIIPDENTVRDLLLGINYDDEDNTPDEVEEKEDNYYEEVVKKEVEEKEEVQEPAKKKKKAVENECPYKQEKAGAPNFGKDWDDYVECDKCVKENSEIYEACKKTYKDNK